MTARPPDLLDRAAFLAAVAAAGVVPEKALAAVTATLPADALTGRPVAQHFVQQGVLTRYQADRLLAGRGDGYHLGQYTILEQLGGRGKAGRVYKARHKAMNRLVAIHVLPAPTALAPADREAFAREARTAAKLAHPNVVTVLDANQIGDRPYVVFEYVEGTTAELLVKEVGPLPVERACEIAVQIAAALEYAHGQGLPHGRLSPDHLRIGTGAGGGRPAVKVANFGITRLSAAPDADTGRLTAAADAAAYLAPEQITDPALVDAAADLFALGAVLYFLLTARPPQPTDPDAHLLPQLGELVPVEVLRPDVPPAVAAVVRDLLHARPGNRPASAADAIARLAPFAVTAAAMAVAPRPIASGSAACPFTALTDDGDGHGQTLDDLGPPTPVATRFPRRRSGGDGVNVWMVIVLAGGIIAATAVAVGIVLKAVIK